MGILEQNVRLFDMHCHLGFVANVEAVRSCLEKGGVRALSCTVSPEEYEHDLDAFATVVTCTVALGLHPWQLRNDTCAEASIARFIEMAPTTRFIGEVGLDYAGTRGEVTARTFQRNAFAQVLAACDAPSAFPRKLLSLHAVRSASDVLDLLEQRDTLSRHDCIFHWFAGTSDELNRAIAAGCFFSVGPRMLATKRGREYARVIPSERLLIETDAPSQAGGAWDCVEWTEQLMQALVDIANERNVPWEELARTVSRTSENLLRRA